MGEDRNLTMPVDGKFELIEWPNPALLEPVISKETMLLHHGKHLAAYVNNLNALLPGTEWEGLPLEEIVRRAPEGPILNNAGQVLNHNMFFEQMSRPRMNDEDRTLHYSRLCPHWCISSQYGHWRTQSETLTREVSGDHSSDCSSWLPSTWQSVCSHHH